ncbi:hypothetical protein COV17_03945 [Candidatus Woesearchaeota archaeon CG10_big_fil_rev_8_21_14_0_10_36_11]|nr:MAG: hypothetical protein COV17_03945 [Candidatus Woesearchaeota archaeon CG10_big_fil_rev_8_21_14_0_10_36_11]
MDTTQLLGWIATFLFSVMLIPQIIKTIKLKDTKGVSLLLFISYLAANIIALIYAYMIHQPPLIFKYLLGIITAEIYIIIFLTYYKRKIFKPKNVHACHITENVISNE